MPTDITCDNCYHHNGVVTELCDNCFRIKLEMEKILKPQKIKIPKKPQ